jgi:hypothetical protein
LDPKNEDAPSNVGALKTQLKANGVDAKVAGPDTTGVEFWDYPPDNKPIRIALPTEAMLDERLQTVRHPGVAAYPLPHFYGIAFGGVARAQLSEPVSLEFAARRIGEYSVNECC